MPFLLTIETRDIGFVHWDNGVRFRRPTFVRLMTDLPTVAACTLLELLVRMLRILTLV